MDEMLFMKNSMGAAVKPKIESLWLAVWDRIPEKDRYVVWTNFEIIICKPIDVQWPSSPDGGLTQSSDTGRCWVTYNPFGMIKNRETQLYCLAHELAHAFLKHPNKSRDILVKDSDNYKKEEREAHKKAHEMGIYTYTKR